MYRLDDRCPECNGELELEEIFHEGNHVVESNYECWLRCKSCDWITEDIDWREE